MIEAPGKCVGGGRWQDTSGNWHYVEDWQEVLGLEGFERWWVAAKDFKTGLVRWLVTQGPTGPDSQNLQIQPGCQVVRVIDLTLLQGLSRPARLIFFLSYRGLELVSGLTPTSNLSVVVDPVAPVFCL
jgi:hypothetical protein